MNEYIIIEYLFYGNESPPRLSPPDISMISPLHSASNPNCITTSLESPVNGVPRAASTGDEPDGLRLISLGIEG